MLLVFLDSEATGMDPEKHRAIELAFKIYDSVSFHLVNSYESIISQSQEVWAEADPESSKIHGFTYEEILKGKNEQAIRGEVITYLNNAKISQKGGVFICQNPSFDRVLFNKIVSERLQKQYNWPYHWLDLASMYWTFLHYEKKSKLGEIQEKDLSKNHIAEHFGIAPEPYPHRAMNGVNHLVHCYQALFDQIQAHASHEAVE